MAAEHTDAAAAIEQDPELIEKGDSPAYRGSDGRASHAQAWKAGPSVDETGVEHQVDEIRQPQDAHCDGGIARAAKHAVDQEQEHDGGVSAEDHGCKAGAHMDDSGGGVHP